MLNLSRCLWRSLVLTRKENVLLHIQSSGSHYSLDFGTSWNDLKHAGAAGAVFETRYYPRAVEAADGTIIMTSHTGADDAFMPRWPNGSLAHSHGGPADPPFSHDENIWAQTFRLAPV